MSSSPKRFCQNIQNTLNLLSENNLTIFHNQPVIKEYQNVTSITWPNHVPGRHNCAPVFGKISQYRTILETGAFTCLLFDGALVRIAYSFKFGSLADYSLLWWPSPFKIDSGDLELGGILDIFDLYASSNDWHENIQMRTPVRFDFDSNNATIKHPASHLHFQESNCRLYVDRPVCFNRFIKFIFLNFYPNTYSNFSFWEDLEDVSLTAKAFDLPVRNYPYVGWEDKGTLSTCGT
jgi:hypothetical protein